MFNQADLDHLKSYMPDYLAILESRGKDISLKHKFTCLNSGHEDSTPSMKYYPKKQIVKCFGCQAAYDLFDLIGMFEADCGTFDKQVLWAAKRFGVVLQTGPDSPTKQPPTSGKAQGMDFSILPAKETPTPSSKPKPAEATKPEPAVDYTPLYVQWHKDLRQTAGYKYFTEERGISDIVIDRYLLGYDKERKVITIPVTKTYYITRKLAYKKFYNNRPSDEYPIGPFNLDALHQPDPVFITESAIDALSIEEMGYHALSINGCPHASKLTEYLRKNDIIARWLILALDSDEEGQKTQNELAARLTDMGYETRELIWPPNYALKSAKNEKGIVDANLMLKLHKNDFRALLDDFAKIDPKPEVKMDKKQVKQPETKPEIDPLSHESNSIKAYVENFFETAPDGKGINCGLEDLNDIFDGGLFEGLYAIGGISGGGKTSLCLQMAAFIAEHGGTAIYVHYEQGRRDLMNKLISMRSFIATGKNTDKAATFGEVRKFNYLHKDKKIVCRAALEHVLDYEGDLVVYHGCTDIPSMMLQYKDSKPVLIVDYLHIMPPLPDTKRSDSYEQIKANLTMLRQLATKYSMPVLLLCSLNRTGTLEDNLEHFQMSYFRDSGYIEYSADFAFGICPVLNGNKLEDWMEGDERLTNIQVVKNRNGSHNTARLKFHGPYSYYENTKHQN